MPPSNRRLRVHVWLASISLIALTFIMLIAIFMWPAEADAFDSQCRRNSLAFQHTHSSELICLATAVYHEAKAQDEVGKELVAWVIINRTRSPDWPHTVCEVVWQPSQFGWTNGSVCTYPNPDSKAWEESVYVARKVMSRQNRPLITATYFMNPNGTPASTREWFYSHLVPLFGYDDPNGGVHHFFRGKNDPATVAKTEAGS